MKFDIFHSIGRVDSLPQRLTDRQCFEQFFTQATLAEDLGYETVWVAESHFSTEVQKGHKSPVVPNYQGEIGLNCDSMQLAAALFAQTKKIGFGTAITNIVGGNGGPIAVADRIRSLAFLNHLHTEPRQLAIGLASGRFPYVNKPFGIVARDDCESLLWPTVQRLIFQEALEIFLRLSRSEVLSSEQILSRYIDQEKLPKGVEWNVATEVALKCGYEVSDKGIRYRNRWDFEPLQLVPQIDQTVCDQWLRFVLGSSDPEARDQALDVCPVDVFNLSFTPPDKINALHEQLGQQYEKRGWEWHRWQMPRTVLVFIDESPAKAEEMASQCFDTYMEAMRGTVKFPPKQYLMDRALIGDAAQIRDALAPGAPHDFRDDDRLMLWFEFNQSDNESICRQMRMFSEKVAARL